MKTVKKLSKENGNYKSKKLRIRSVKLALKTNSQPSEIVNVAERIYKYINEGL